MMEAKLQSRMIEMAAAVRLKARAFTGFHVGAALLTEDGTIITGCNVELHTTLSSICAERTAMAKAVSMGYQSFKAIVVVSDADHPIAPCGFCCQYLVDFNPEMEIIMATADGKQVEACLAKELMPRAFMGSGKSE